MPALLDAPSSLHDAYPGASIQAIRTSPGCKAAMEIARVGYAHPGFGTARSDGDGDGFLLSVALTGARRVLYGAAPPRALPLAPDEITIRPADAPYRADLDTPFDFLYFRVAPESLHRLSEDLGVSSVQTLSCEPGSADPVLARLGNALLPALADPAHADPLFVDQLALAAQVHMIQAYGGGATASQADPAPARGGLAVWQQKLARDMLAADLLADVSISDVAQGCGLSRSYFIKAFRQTMGTTPHRWLLECRVERAKLLLLNSEAPVSDVARDCGFSDQAHLTRVFASVMGAPPAAWRRQNRN
ncbi:AraC family transcriptional regulator [Achromobacter spanius]|uniref:helix-turn-helix domain-containing protein n=1 Tax=Achromobacter spanius TaxID=217203 RepID=UPI0032098679